MTIDCHYHLDPRLQTVESLIAQMKHHRIETTVLMPYICEPVKPPGEMTLSLFRFFLKHRSFRTLAKRLSANFTENGDLNVPSGLVTIHPDPDNAPVFETVRAYPDQFRAWIFVNPNGNKAQVDVYKQWRDADGAIGVKAHPFWHRYPPEALLPVAELLVKDNRPIIMHMGYNPSFDGDLDSLINELPDLKVILAHAAFPDYHDRWKSIKANSNIYVDLSATGFVDKVII